MLLTLFFSNYHAGYLLSLYLNNTVYNNFFIYLIAILNVKVNTVFWTTSILIYFLFFNLFFCYSSIIIEWPNTLLIGLNTIHPIVYYSGFYLFINFFLNKYCFYNYFKLTNILVCITSALILGVFWGLVNNLWGYLWVNDLIEILLLVLFFFCLYILHTYKLFYKFFFFSNILIFLLIIYMLRLNFFSSRHSFFLNPQVISYTTITNIFFFFLLQKSLFKFLSLLLFFCSYLYNFLFIFYLSRSYK